MVCRWGMSEKLGPLAFGKREGEVFLGRDFSAVQGLLRGHRAADRRRGARASSSAATSAARRLLTENMEALKRIADALVEYETLEAEDVDILLQGGSHHPRAAAPARHRAARSHREEGQAEDPRRARGAAQAWSRTRRKPRSLAVEPRPCPRWLRPGGHFLLFARPPRGGVLMLRAAPDPARRPSASTVRRPRLRAWGCPRPPASTCWRSCPQLPCCCSPASATAEGRFLQGHFEASTLPARGYPLCLRRRRTRPGSGAARPARARAVRAR